MEEVSECRHRIMLGSMGSVVAHLGSKPLDASRDVSQAQCICIPQDRHHEARRRLDRHAHIDVIVPPDEICVPAGVHIWHLAQGLHASA